MLYWRLWVVGVCCDVGLVVGVFFVVVLDIFEVCW